MTAKTGPFAIFAAPNAPAQPDFAQAVRDLSFRRPAPEIPVAPSADTLALKRRDWLATVQQRNRALSQTAGGLICVPPIDGQTFLDEFYAPGRPVIIRGAMTDWPALDRWTPDYLKQVVGSAPVQYQADRSSDPEFELNKDAHRATIGFDAFMDAIMADEAGNNAYITAYNNSANAAAFAPLMADLGTLDAYLTRDHGMLWVGPAGTFTPLHFDLTNNLLAQVTGRKRIHLIPPSETRYLAHRRHVFSEVRDITDAAMLARHPQAEKAARYEVVLEAGDLLFIPIGWWHQVRSESFSVMLTYTNFRWPNEGYASYPAG